MSAENARAVALAVGAVGYLDKPFTVFQARATIEAAMRQGAAAPPTLLPVGHDSALRVFVATSQRFLAQMIKLTLDHGVFVTRAVQDFDSAIEIIRDWRPQLAIIDLDSGGDQLLQYLGQNHVGSGQEIPILAVTRQRGIKARLAAFDHGVDDVLAVPMSPEDLLAHVLAILRRTYGQSFELRPVIKLGELEVDILNHEVRFGSSQETLTETEQSLLYLLAANSGEVLATSEILATIWGVDDPSEGPLVDRHIRSLRAKLRNTLHDKLQNGRSGARFVVAVPGQGYRFDPVVLDLAAVTSAPGPPHLSSPRPAQPSAGPIAL